MQHSEQLSAETKRVLRERSWSHMNAQIHTGVSRAVVAQMSHGAVPSALSLLKWARAIGEDPAHWLELAGVDPVSVAVLMQHAPATPTGATESPPSAPDVPAAPQPGPSPTEQLAVRSISAFRDLLDRSPEEQARMLDALDAERDRLRREREELGER